MEKEQENKKPEPSFYAVIPATVRYDKMPDGAKLLFGEITALCNKKGYCWAGNDYFAELYQVHERTIRNWLEALKDKGYISVFFTYVSGKKEIESRFIRLTNAEPAKITQQEKKLDFSAENDEVGKNSSVGGEKNCHTYGNNFPEVGKNSSKGGEKNCRDNTTNNITTTTTTEPPNSSEKPPPEGATAATVNLSPEDIKQAILTLDRSLVLKSDFYSRAAAFMALHYLDKSYLKWLFKQVELREPNNFDGLFFTLFFAENMVEKYKISRQSAIPPPPTEIKCPVCGTVHDKKIEKCPLCSLPKDSSPNSIAFFKKLNTLPPDKRNEYIQKLDDIYNNFEAKNMFNSSEVEKRENKIKALNEEYGIEVKNEEPSLCYHS